MQSSPGKSGKKQKNVSKRTLMSVLQEADDATARVTLEKMAEVKVKSGCIFVEQDKWNVAKHGPVPSQKPETHDLYKNGV